MQGYLQNHNPTPDPWRCPQPGPAHPPGVREVPLTGGHLASLDLRLDATQFITMHTLFTKVKEKETN